MSEKDLSVNAEIGGQVWNFTPNKLALQANGSVMIRVGDTVVMGTAVMSKNQREGIDYLPLLVDYEEKLYAAGKIKGSRWVKREGRPTDEAILTGRLIDRCLRPMFNSKIRKDIQVVVTVLSSDLVNDPDIIGLNAASAALELSDISWDGPVAGVRVGRIDGKFVLNPSFEQIQDHSDLDLVVAGTAEHIIMVEAGAKEVAEEDLLKAMEFAQGHIGIILKGIADVRKASGKEKNSVTVFEPDSQTVEKVKGYEAQLTEVLYVADLKARDTGVQNLREEIVKEVAGDDENLVREVNWVLDETIKKIIQKQILEHDRRLDGRKLDEVREIICEVGLLPRVHGTGLFRRGDTQVLTTVTVGGPGDEQLLEDLDTEEERKKRYMHHYNMPGFSSGEVSPMRSPGRREIGHGALAERALISMIPEKTIFPYTLRLVSEVVSSNGSTSMASTCGSTLALMDAGIPLKAPVSGIAMGLVLGDGKYKILSDIIGMEDGNGHMDFKVAGTKTGVTALQMDTKAKGLTLEILKDALKQAHTGRQHILQKMLEVIPVPRENMSRFAPRVVTLQISPDKIREVIGPGGKIINAIIAETGVEIDIEDSGLVMITSVHEEGAKQAIERIKNLTREVMAGEEFQAKITRIMDFGAFAEVLPGHEGLIHISELAPFRVEKVTDIVQVGDIVPVKVVKIDELGRINLSRKAMLPNAPQGEQGSDRNRSSSGPRGPRDKHHSGSRPHRPRP